MTDTMTGIRAWRERNSNRAMRSDPHYRPGLASNHPQRDDPMSEAYVPATDTPVNAWPVMPVDNG